MSPLRMPMPAAAAALVTAALLAGLAAGAPARTVPRANGGGFPDGSDAGATLAAGATTVAVDVDPKLVGGAADGTGGGAAAPSGAEQAGDVGVASTPATAPDPAKLRRRAGSALGEDAIPVALDLAGWLTAYAPASASSIVAVHPGRRPLGTPVLVLAATRGTVAVGIRSTLLVDGGRPAIDLPRQAASLQRDRIMIVRVRTTAAQRALIAGSAKPRLKVRVAVVDPGGARHEITRTTAIAAPAAPAARR